MTSSQLTEERAPDATHAPYRIIVVHHTHWDREWWATFQDFRIRLVELIDSLLEALDSDPDFRTFLLDGQTIVLRDYLEIRPENREKLVRYIQENRIQCGPWYILPDEYLVSGEAHIRNLLLGIRTARELDIPLQSVGYIPDTFGHIAQMPQILTGFGIDNAFVWRGRGGEHDTVKQEFCWISPDGSEVLAHWFPEGYYQMPFLHLDNPARPYEDKLGRIFGMLERWGPRATAGVILMPYGGDHQPIDRRLPEKIAEVNGQIQELARIEWGTSQDYLRAVREKSPQLELVRGELRAFGINHPHVLPGVLSTRLYLKRLNFQCQTWLERYAEPLSALAWLRGRRYDQGLLWKAWELLVQNHPHDSICGCSIDQVHREMLPRFDQSRQIAQILSEKAADHIADGIDTSDLAADERALVVHNTLPWERTGWASIWLPRMEISPRTHRLVTAEGDDVPFHVDQVDGVRPMRDKWEYTEIGFVARAVPGLGYATYRLIPRQIPLDPKQVFFTARRPVARLKGSVLVSDVSVGDGVLENQYVRVEVDPRRGTLVVTDKRSGEIYPGLNDFEDGGDAGDEYNYSRPLSDTVLRSSDTARVLVSVAEAGYARATLRVDIDWSLPAELRTDRLSRCSEYVDTRISTFITLVSESPRVDITTQWDNGSKDHRLRALFPLGAPVQFSEAEGHFSVERRPVGVDDPGNGWSEPYVPTMPQQGWVSVSDRARGLMVANRGLPEFETLDDGQGTIALTILRAVGWLSREDMLSRIGGAGPTIPTPEAQMLGPNSVSYSIIPHEGSWLESRAYLWAEEYIAPLYGAATGSHPGDALWTDGIADVTGEHTLLFSALKRAEGSEDLVLRCWNVAGTSTQCRVSLRHRPSSVRLVDLKEESIEDGEISIEDDGGFTLSVGPSRIVTVAVSFA